MDLQAYYALIRRWLWLLCVCLVLGAGAGYSISRLQRPVFQASTKLIMLRAQGDSLLPMGSLDQGELIQTYTQLLLTDSVRRATEERLGYAVSPRQIDVERISDTQLIEVTTEGSSPQNAADLANELVAVFVEQAEALQSSRFSSLEDSLQAQLNQVQEQMNGLQSDITQLSDESTRSYLQEVEGQLAELSAEMESLEEEIVTMEDAADYAPNPAVLGPRRPTPSTEERVQWTIKRSHLQQLQDLYNLYQGVYVSLAVPGGASGTGRVTRADQMQATLALYQQIYSSLLSDYEAVRLARLRTTPDVLQVEEALPPSTPVRPRPVSNAVMGSLLGLMLAASIAFAVEYFDNTLKTPEEIARSIGLPVIGYIPELEPVRGQKGDEKLPVLKQPSSPIADGFRLLRTNLEFAGASKPLRLILVSSPGPDDGKTMVSVNLAITLAQAGKKVALLDADLRRSSIHEFLGLNARPGLCDCFGESADLSGCLQTGLVKNLDVLVAGDAPPNPVELLSSYRMDEVLDGLRKAHDVILLDSPPFHLADASVLAAKVDGVLVVMRPGHTRTDAALAMLEQLDRAGAQVVGAVLNRIPRDQPTFYGGYYQYAERPKRGARDRFHLGAWLRGRRR